MNKISRRIFLILTVFTLNNAVAHSQASIKIFDSTPSSVTHHTITLNEKKYAYTTTIGTITLYNKENQPKATMSYTADIVDNTSSVKRPITFIYNGGPGSSSMLLRMASFGPKRIILNSYDPTKPAPYHLTDNQYSLLNKTDLVFIDMPGTGFGRFLGKNKLANSLNVDSDVDSFATFIQTYINQNQRWNSPKFLFGESYGTTRSAILVNELQQRGTQINGIVLLSSILDYGLLQDHQGMGDWEYVLYLPSFAATAWYFHKTDYHPESLETLLNEVKQFALTEYLEALAQGSTLSQEKAHAIALKLSRYLGISATYLERKNLRLSTQQFSSLLLRKKDKYLGRYDARFTLFSPAKTLHDSLLNSHDSTMITLKDATVTMTQQYYEQDLHYKNPLPYIFGLNIYDQWDFRHGAQRLVNSSVDLTNAIIENPYLKIFSGNGYYDFATPFSATVYTFDHLNIPTSSRDNITIKLYPAGHMIYLDPQSLAKLKQDLDIWYSTMEQNPH